MHAFKDFKQAEHKKQCKSSKCIHMYDILVLTIDDSLDGVDEVDGIEAWSGCTGAQVKRVGLLHSVVVPNA